MQYVDDAKQLWQQALTACTPLTDVSLVVQVHKLLHSPGAIAAALGADGPQQSIHTPAILPDGIATVHSLSNVYADSNCAQMPILRQIWLPPVCVSKLPVHPVQAAPVKPTQNGTMATPQASQAAKPSQAIAKPTDLPDPSVAISLAVTQINAGKLDDADKLLSGIIIETDKRTPNLGAHVARGTARALRRELQGGGLTIHRLPDFVLTSISHNKPTNPI